jgi:hypothetical protein
MAHGNVNEILGLERIYCQLLFALCTDTSFSGDYLPECVGTSTGGKERRTRAEGEREREREREGCV